MWKYDAVDWVACSLLTFYPWQTDLHSASSSAGSQEYWDARYAKETEPFDWYQRYSGLRPVFSRFLPRGQRILHAGCGNSRLAEELLDDGYADIVNVDLSPTVIAAMRTRYRQRSGLTWIAGNMTVLATAAPPQFAADASYGAVVDKGTLDSILCGEAATAQAAKYLGEVSRLLRPGGVLLVVSFGTPETRLRCVWLASRSVTR